MFENSLADSFLRKSSEWLLKSRSPKIVSTLIVTGLAAVTMSAAQATTYYVSSSGGNDGNNGTSQSSAWKTLAKTNATAFLPGDQILFKRGDNWYESLQGSSDGVQGNSITYADYGTGTKPTFWGSNPFPKTCEYQHDSLQVAS